MAVHTTDRPPRLRHSRILAAAPAGAAARDGATAGTGGAERDGATARDGGAGRDGAAHAPARPARIVKLTQRTGLQLTAETTLVLRGQLTHSCAHALEEAIERMCDGGVRRITLDLRELSAIDWAGIMVIVFRRRLCEQRGHELRLIAGPPQVQEAFARADLLDALCFVKLTGDADPQ